jgi:hypothetical protein
MFAYLPVTAGVAALLKSDMICNLYSWERHAEGSSYFLHLIAEYSDGWPTSTFPETSDESFQQAA